MTASGTGRIDTRSVPAPSTTMPRATTVWSARTRATTTTYGSRPSAWACRTAGGACACWTWAAARGVHRGVAGGRAGGRDHRRRRVRGDAERGAGQELAGHRDLRARQRDEPGCGGVTGSFDGILAAYLLRNLPAPDIALRRSTTSSSRALRWPCTTTRCATRPAAGGVDARVLDDHHPDGPPAYRLERALPLPVAQRAAVRRGQAAGAAAARRRVRRRAVPDGGRLAAGHRAHRSRRAPGAGDRADAAGAGRAGDAAGGPVAGAPLRVPGQRAERA